MRLSLCRLSESNIFGVRAIFYMLACCVFLQVVLAIVPLMGGCVSCCGDQSMHRILGRTSLLLCGCHSPVGGRVCSRVVAVEASRSGSKLQCEVGGTGAFSLGKEPLHITPWGLSTRDVGFCDATHYLV